MYNAQSGLLSSLGQTERGARRLHVVLNRIYTKTGDDGTTALGSGARVAKHHLRIQSNGTVDETNSVIAWRASTRPSRAQGGRRHAGPDPERPVRPRRRPVRSRHGEPLAWTPLRVGADQVTRLESEIDTLNGELEPLRSFVLPGGHPAAAQLHVARTVCRRAERLMTELALLPGETVSAAAAQYVNRLSDFLFVASRYINARTGVGDVLWVPGKTRTGGDPTQAMFVPLHDDAPLRVIRFQVVNGLLILTNLIVFLYTNYGLTEPQAVALATSWAWCRR